MSTTLTAAPPHGFALLLGRRRVRFTLCASFVIGLPIGLGWHSSFMCASWLTPAHRRHRPCWAA
ncbi:MULTISPECIES: hypothetical protein [unclassified Duganella]|uniref:hypothetical protein n=1 Tax=unclassified Duganella TaxID=2636909 RepID=UPI0013143BBB|nr:MULTISPECIES: hypothetical protein [unclassified Duganella]